MKWTCTPRKTHKEFDDLKNGEAFIHNNVLFVKIGSCCDQENVYNFAAETTEYFPYDVKVEVVKIKNIEVEI